ncbi:hypothetical protein [Bacillus methanolicus]|uniref:Uncharacterized protein n=1 Tax=Bacillus methanolicus (strain MGA3 / ATCC 53907) TaxID=796606 RepID=A0A068LVR7_BACMM|nr:hypothetical protein [Bacillus methanolicus]AIE61073.1 hypothetical protein BMMGA3_13415 [Bacillus methanolicus MGA3]
MVGLWKRYVLSYLSMLMEEFVRSAPIQVVVHQNVLLILTK